MKKNLYTVLFLVFILSLSNSCFANNIAESNTAGSPKVPKVSTQASDTNGTGNGDASANTTNNNTANFSQYNNNGVVEVENNNTPVLPHKDVCQQTIEGILKMLKDQDKGEREGELEDLQACISAEPQCQTYIKALEKYRNYCSETIKRQTERQKSDFDNVKNPNADKETKNTGNSEDNYKILSVMAFIDAKYIISYKAYSIARKSSDIKLKKSAPHYLRLYKEATAEKLRIMLEDGLYDPQSPKNPAAKYNSKFSANHNGNYVNTELEKKNEVNKLAKNLKNEMENAKKYYNFNKELEEIFINSKNKKYFEEVKKRLNKALNKDQAQGKPDPDAPNSKVSDDKINDFNSNSGSYKKNTKLVETINVEAKAKQVGQTSSIKPKTEKIATETMKLQIEDKTHDPRDIATDNEIYNEWLRKHPEDKDMDNGELLQKITLAADNFLKNLGSKANELSEEEVIRLFRNSIK